MKHKHHKIIFKNGQRIRTNELITYTIEEHAAEHKRLWEKGKHWKDYVAWQGLSGQIKSKDVIMEVYKQNGKANQKYTQTKEAIRKMVMTKKGSKLSEKHKEAISEGLKGHIVSDKQKIKVANALSKNWLITTPQGRTFEIKNLLDFARKHKLDQGNLVKVAQHKLKSHKGYVVTYK